MAWSDAARAAALEARRQHKVLAEQGTLMKKARAFEARVAARAKKLGYKDVGAYRAALANKVIVGAVKAPTKLAWDNPLNTWKRGKSGWERNR